MQVPTHTGVSLTVGGNEARGLAKSEYFVFHSADNVEKFVSSKAWRTADGRIGKGSPGRAAMPNGPSTRSSGNGPTASSKGDGSKEAAYRHRLAFSRSSCFLADGSSSKRDLMAEVSPEVAARPVDAPDSLERTCRWLVLMPAGHG